MNDSDKNAIEWFEHKLNKTIGEIEQQFEKFRISDALHLIYKLIWDDFCGWYLEAVKPNYGEGVSEEVYKTTIAFFEELMKLVHPFMPFQSEEIWQLISERSIEEALIVAQQKKAAVFNEEIIKNFETAEEIILSLIHI